MAFRHGVYGSERATSVLPPAQVDAGLPVVFGIAPINQSKSAPVNMPVLCYSYEEAVTNFGISSNWEKYDLCEFIDCHFGKFSMAPVVLVNVIDPVKHKKDIPKNSIAFLKGKGVIASESVIISSLQVSSASTTYKKDVDYSVAFDTDNDTLVVARIPGGAIPENLTSLDVQYSELDPSLITANDIIGGVDITTGEYKGLEILSKIFPIFRKVPGQVLCPKWSETPGVAAVMSAKAGNINGHFKAMALCDIPAHTVTKYADAPKWKNDNNYVYANQEVFWPRVKLDNKIYHGAVQTAGVTCRTDFDNNDIPYASPSNHNLQANGSVMSVDNTEIHLALEQANYLNSNGIITALNHIGGWKLWGNRTAAYPAITDPKDCWIPGRRMFNWINNTLILTFWQKVDAPTNRRLIETVVDSANIWLNGLVAQQYLLGARVEFIKTENPITDLMNGIIRFHVYYVYPPTAETIEFIQEYDPQYLNTLFPTA